MEIQGRLAEIPLELVREVIDNILGKEKAMS